MADILQQMEQEIGDLGGDVYDPSEEFEGAADAGERADAIPGLVWPDPDPVERSLSWREWGIRGEGLDADREQFAAMLNEGRIGSQPVEIAPSRPEQASGWGQSSMGIARSAQKERGKHLFAHIAISPGSMVRVEGQVGANTMGGTAEEFIHEVEPVVHDYVERFEAGDRPGRYYAMLDNDGTLVGPQEGRHRAVAAYMAGLDWVPVVLLWDTSGTFRRPSSISEGTEGYRMDYPE